jgi:hypothetical protein
MAVMTLDQLKANADGAGMVTGYVSVDLSDIIGGDLEVFLVLISLHLTGTWLLTEIDYTPVGVEDGAILFRVSGNISMIH